MFRLRFAAPGAACLLVLACGCTCCHRPFLGLGHRETVPAECCDIEALPDAGVPSGGGCGAAPGPINPGFIPGTIPQGPPPQMQPPPGDRLQPIPNVAPRYPASPSSLK
jgi:hypothetical protein